MSHSHVFSGGYPKERGEGGGGDCSVVRARQKVVCLVHLMFLVVLNLIAYKIMIVVPPIFDQGKISIRLSYNYLSMLTYECKNIYS